MGDTLAELIARGDSLPELLAAGFSISELKAAGFTAGEFNVHPGWSRQGQDIDGEAANDYSGRAVSTSADGQIVAIGAHRNDDNATDSGHVRVYKNESGTWTQIGQDIDGEAPYDNSGYSVSLSADGQIVAIGATSNDGNGPNSGRVRVYKNESGTWTQIGQDIDGEVAYDNSGWSVSLSNDGQIVAIGAPYNDANGGSSGHVRVYKNESGTWTQIGQDIDGEAAVNDNSGYSVSLSADGSIVAIGAPYNDGNGSSSGHVRVYKNESGTWTQIGQDIDGEATYDNSGRAVSLSNDGSIVAIGAPYNDANGGSSAGHVRVYQNVSGTWTQIGQDIDGEAAYNDYSGYSLNLSADGSIVAIGAYGNDDNGTDSGHVRVYKNESGTWTQIGQDIDGEATYDNSGYSVSLSADGSIVAIGASGNDDNGTDSGHVRVMRYYDYYLTTTATELKAAGFTAAELKAAGFTLAELKGVFTLAELKDGGFTATELKAAGFTATELKAVGFTAAELEVAGFTLAELVALGFTVAEIYAEYLIDSIFENVFTLNPPSFGFFKNLLGDNFDWTLNTGGTSSGGTGPDASTTDVYIYTESSSPNYPNKTANGQIDVYLLDGGSFRFDTHMYGSSMGSLTITLYTLNLETLQIESKGVIFDKSGDQGNQWNSESLTLSAGYSQLIIESKSGTSFTSDIAIRNIKVFPPIADLIAAGYTLAELKAAGFTATELKATGYTLAELKTAGFTATELRAAGYTLAELKAAGYTGAEFKAAGFTATESKGVFTLAELKDGGFTATELVAAGFTAAELVAAGFTAAELKVAGFTPAELVAVGFTVDEIYASYLIDSNFENVFTLNPRSFGIFQNLPGDDFDWTLNTGGTGSGGTGPDASTTDVYIYTEASSPNYPDKTANGQIELYLPGARELTFDTHMYGDSTGSLTITLYTLNLETLQIESKGVIFDKSGDQGNQWISESLTLSAGYSRLFIEGKTSTSFTSDIAIRNIKILPATIDLADLIAAGSTLAELKELFTLVELKEFFTLAELKAAGFTLAELKLEFTLSELKDAGFTATELKATGYTLAELKDAGFTATELKAAGYTLAELKTAGFTATELKATGYTLAELKTAGYTLAELKDAGFTATELKATGYTLAELKTAGFTVAELDAAGYTLKQLKNAGFTADLTVGTYKIGPVVSLYSSIELEAAGITLETLIAYKKGLLDIATAYPIKTSFTPRYLKATYTIREMNVLWSLSELAQTFSLLEMNNEYSLPELHKKKVYDFEQMDIDFDFLDLRRRFTLRNLNTIFSLTRLHSEISLKILNTEFTLRELNKSFSLKKLHEEFTYNQLRNEFTELELATENIYNFQPEPSPSPSPSPEPEPEPEPEPASWKSWGPKNTTEGQIENVAPNNNIAGATETVWCDPTDSNIILIGAVNGGIWKTTNAKSNNLDDIVWTSKTDELDTSITEIKSDVIDSNKLVAVCGRTSSFRQIGNLSKHCYISNDKGETWNKKLINTYDDKYYDCNSVCMWNDGMSILIGSHYDGVIEGVSDHSEMAPAGLYLSTDGGDNWAHLSVPTETSKNDYPVTSIELSITETGVRYLYAGMLGKGIYRSADDGTTWTNLTENIDYINSIMTTSNNNILLSCCKSSQNVLYAIFTVNGIASVMCYTEDYGNNWVRMDNPSTFDAAGNIHYANPMTNKDGTPRTPKAGAQGAIHLSLFANPNDSNIVYAGGDRQPELYGIIGNDNWTARLFRGDRRYTPQANFESSPTQYSEQWSIITNNAPSNTSETNYGGLARGGTGNNSAPHADSRAMSMDADGALIEVSDGGIYRLTTTLADPTSQTAIWQSLCSNLCIFEIHSLAYDSVNEYVIVGTQDNGTIVSNQTSSQNIFGGDGGDAQCGKIEGEDKTIIYSSSQGGGGLFWSEISNFTNLSDYNFLDSPSGYVNSELRGNMTFVPITAINTYNPKLLLGSANVNDDNKIISHNIETGEDTVFFTNSLAGADDWFYPRKLIYGHPQNHAAAFVLTVTGKCAIHTDSFSRIYDTRTNTNDRYNSDDRVFSFDVDPTDLFKVYIIEGDRANQPLKYENEILICNLSSTGPDVTSIERVEIPYPGSRCIKYHNNKLYIGCSKGVYSYDLTTEIWSDVLNDSLPNSIVYDMILYENKLFVSTMGRGVFSIDL